METLIYAGLWLIAVVLFLLDIMRWRSYTDLPLLDVESVGRMLWTLLPFMALFVVNNYVLIPRLLKRGRYSAYLAWALCSIALIWLWQYFEFSTMMRHACGPARPGHRGGDHPGPHPLLPLPLFLGCIYDFLIVGVNLAISLLFQQFADRLAHESLMKENAENQLTYLKAQINPHFYMNMLNNIHGMIEIDAEKAQDMVIEMSGLMRHLLYEGSRAEVELGAEADFIRDYLSLMRVRYPEDKVEICADLPSAVSVAGVRIPPLLFLVFIENAFKHGVSYTECSFVSVSLTAGDGHVTFRCMNSVHTAPCVAGSGHEGIGLDNVRRRLDILYGAAYTLETVRTDSAYTVILTFPYETQDVDNR